MNTTLTASAVFCAALISGCSSAPTLPEPTGEWEDFTQAPAIAPRSYSEPVARSFSPTPAPMPAPAPAVAYKSTPSVTPSVPMAPVAPKAPETASPAATASTAPTPLVASTPSQPKPAAVQPVAAAPAADQVPAKAPVSVSAAPGEAGKVLGRQVGVLASLQPKATVAAPIVLPATKPAPPVIEAMTQATPAAPIKPTAAPPKPVQSWSVSPQDKTIRETLAKWAAKDGWTFNPVGRQHWTVAEDFDVVASDTLHGTFIEAVQQLIGTTELTKTPLQPCFYSNHVVRVIYINEQCSFQTAQLRNP